MRNTLMRSFLIALVTIASFNSALSAQPLAQRPGWQVIPTDKPHESLISDLRRAVGEQGLIVVTQAGPTAAAARRGITIPGNMVIGVFSNDFAVQVLATSTAALIEAPIRFYVTEDPDGSATLSYKRPSHVFAPYFDEGGTALRSLASELDQRFDAIAQSATRQSQ